MPDIRFWRGQLQPVNAAQPIRGQRFPAQREAEHIAILVHVCRSALDDADIRADGAVCLLTAAEFVAPRVLQAGAQGKRAAERFAAVAGLGGQRHRVVAFLRVLRDDGVFLTVARVDEFQRRALGHVRRVDGDRAADQQIFPRVQLNGGPAHGDEVLVQVAGGNRFADANHDILAIAVLAVPDVTGDLSIIPVQFADEVFVKFDRILRYSLIAIPDGDLDPKVAALNVDSIVGAADGSQTSNRTVRMDFNRTRYQAASRNRAVRNYQYSRIEHAFGYSAAINFHDIRRVEVAFFYCAINSRVGAAQRRSVNGHVRVHLHVFVRKPGEGEPCVARVIIAVEVQRIVLQRPFVVGGDCEGGGESSDLIERGILKEHRAVVDGPVVALHVIEGQGPGRAHIFQRTRNSLLTEFPGIPRYGQAVLLGICINAQAVRAAVEGQHVVQGILAAIPAFAHRDSQRLIGLNIDVVFRASQRMPGIIRRHAVDRAAIQRGVRRNPEAGPASDRSVRAGHVPVVRGRRKPTHSGGQGFANLHRCKRAVHLGERSAAMADAEGRRNEARVLMGQAQHGVRCDGRAVLHPDHVAALGIKAIQQVNQVQRIARITHRLGCAVDVDAQGDGACVRYGGGNLTQREGATCDGTRVVYAGNVRQRDTGVFDGA